jgi:hypothetical protein
VIKECCRKPENLSPPEPSGPPGEMMQRCQVCQCRHFRLSLDPGQYKALLSTLGKQ